MGLGLIDKNELSDWSLETLDSLAASGRGCFSNGPFGSNLVKADLVNSGVPVIYIRDIREGKYIRVSEPFVTPKKAKELATCVVKPGDLLIAKVGDPPGTSAVYPDNEPEAIITQDVVRLRLNTEIADANFVHHWLNSPLGKHVVSFITVEATRARFALREFKQLKIPLPPLAEQKRIAGILDAADALRVKRREAISQLDALLQSTFLTLFGDPVSNPMGWDTCLLETVSEKITDGTHKTPKYTDSGIEFLSAKDIKHGSIQWNTEKFISEEEHERLINRCHPEIGDILLAKSGSLGSVAIIDRDHAFSLFESLCLIKHNRQTIEAQFLTAMLENPRMQTRLLSRNKGISIKHLHLTDIRKLKILLPSLDKQHYFATVVSSIEKQKAQQRAHLAQLDTLFAALQSRAFKGEL